MTHNFLKPKKHWETHGLKWTSPFIRLIVSVMWNNRQGVFKSSTADILKQTYSEIINMYFR